MRTAILLVTLLPFIPTTAKASDNPLPQGCVGQLGENRLRQYEVVELAWSPDSAVLASAGSDVVVRLWDPKTGRQLKSFDHVKDTGSWIRSLSFSADGKFVLTSNLWMWQVDSGKLIRICEDANTCVSHAQFSPDGKRLGVVDEDGETALLVLETASGKQLQKLEGIKNSDDAEKLLRHGSWSGFSKDLRLGVSLAGTDRVCVFEFPGFRLVCELKLGALNDPCGPGSIAVSASGKYIAVQFREAPALLWDSSQGEKAAQQLGRASFLKFSEDEKFLISAHQDEIAVWDTAKAALVKRFHCTPGTEFFRAALSPDGKLLAATGGGSIHLWNFQTGEEVFKHSPGIADLVWLSPREVLSIGYGKTATLHDLREGTYGLLRMPLKHAAVARLSQDNKTLIICGPKGDQLAPGEAPATILGGECRFLSLESDVFGMDISSDGRSVLTWGSERTLHRRSVASGDVLRTISIDLGTGRRERRTDISHAAFCALDAMAAVACNDGSLRLVEWENGSELKKLRSAGRGETTHALACSPDGTLLATGGTRAISLFDTWTGEPFETIQEVAFGTDPVVHDLKFSPNSALLVASTACGHIVFIDPLSGQTLHRLKLDGPVQAVTFRPDGKRLAHTLADGTALIWDLPRPVLEALNARRELPERELQAAWRALASGGAPEALKAVRTLVVGGKRSLDFLKARLSASKPNPKLLQLIDDLLSQLDDEQFSVREAAALQLDELLPAAESHLLRTLEHKPSAEVARACTERLNQLDAKFQSSGERLRYLRVLQVLERMGSPEAAELLNALATAPPRAARATQATAARVNHAR